MADPPLIPPGQTSVQPLADTPFWRTAGLALWWLVVAAALLTNVIAIPFRRAEMLTPCQAPSACAMGQLAQAEHLALGALGVSVEAYFWVLEGVALLVLGFCTVAAATLVLGRKSSRVAWVTSMFLVLSATGSTLNIPALQAAHPEFWPWYSALSAGAAATIILLFFIFPNGKFAPAWTRPAAGAWLLLQLMSVPLRQSVDGDRLMSVALLFGLLSVAIAQVQRYRTISTPNERQQTKWLLLSCAIQALSYAVAIVVTVAYLGDARPSLDRVATQTVLKLLLDGTLVLVVIALVFAVRRHRLWDIDLVIHRSLIYASVTVLLAVVFGASVWLLQHLAIRFTDDTQTPLALALSALVAGASFSPARRRLCLLVDRYLYGIGVDVAQVEASRRSPQQPVSEVGPRGSVESIPIRTFASAFDPSLALTEDASGRDGDEDDISLLVTLDGSAGPPRPGGSTTGDLPVSFRDLELIGQGGMSRIFKASHPVLGRTVAIKVLLTELARSSPSSTVRFEREGSMLMDVQHPNIIRVFDHGRAADGVLYQVMEYVDGPDLGVHLSQTGRLSLRAAIPVLQQIAAALDHIHERGIVHRDIKPSNILLEWDRSVGDPSEIRAVLADFGIARSEAMDRLTSSELIGTLLYVAPEQIQQSSTVDARTDVYSLGVMTYELLTGRPPFSGAHAINLIMAHLKQPPTNPRITVPDLPADAAAVVLAALEKRPSDRPQSAGELIARLAAASDGGEEAQARTAPSRARLATSC